MPPGPASTDGSRAQQSSTALEYSSRTVLKLHPPTRDAYAATRAAARLGHEIPVTVSD